MPSRCASVTCNQQQRNCFFFPCEHSKCLYSQSYSSGYCVCTRCSSPDQNKLAITHHSRAPSRSARGIPHDLAVMNDLAACPRRNRHTISTNRTRRCSHSERQVTPRGSRPCNSEVSMRRRHRPVHPGYVSSMRYNVVSSKSGRSWFHTQDIVGL